MSKQCPVCKKITKGQVEDCGSCGFSFEARHKRKSGFAEACLRIGVGITIVASVAAVIAKLI
jgi:hypothetical protein